MTLTTLAALGDERVREIRLEHLVARHWVPPLYAGDADDRPELIHFLWNGVGFNAALYLRSERMRRLHMLDERDDAVVFSPLAMSNLGHLTVSNIMRPSALRALFRASPGDLQVLEVVLHPGEREVPGYARMLDYRGRAWKRCDSLTTLKLSAVDTGVAYVTPLGPVEVTVAQVREFMMAIASRMLRLEVDNVIVPGRNY
ncbi:hypothetical protein AURDEDRAFT_160672 [Auricularia subglabra TFB-10046 SS5]|nr:hypothetical protein AURDEDRAFT_160672 [Auricularia subglabra TFB-10046 SS5]